MMQTALLDGKCEETNVRCSGYSGLENLGNTCFLNSVLQVLAYSPNLAKNLTNLKPSIQKVLVRNETNDDDKAKLNFSIELESILFQINSRTCQLNNCDGEKNVGCIKPSNLLESLRLVCPLFEPYTQQDVHECLNCILNIINDVINLVVTANAVEHKLPTRKEGLFKLFGGRTGDVVVKKQNNENLDPSHQSKPAAKSLNIKGPILKSINRKVLAPRPNPIIVGKKYSPYKQGNITGSDGDSKTVHTPTGGCYERFKRKRYNNIQSSYDVQKQMQGVKATSFYSKLSPPAKRKRASLFKTDARKPLPTVKSKKLFPARKPKQTKFFPLKFKSKSIISDGDEFPQFASEEKEITEDTNFIKELFCGELANTNKCLECESAQIRKEAFMDLSLPVKESQETINKTTTDDNSESLFELIEESSCSSCSLSWSFNEFAKTEILTGENMYSCENCRRLVEASQCVKFLSLPSVLNIHLKRFSTQMLGNNESPISIINKNNISFTVPRTCSVKEWCSSSCKSNDAEYKLFAIIVHRGSTMFSGHYLSYVNVGEKEDIWIEADDDNTKVVSTDELDEVLLSSNRNSFTAHTPYMLFYRKLQ